MNAEAGTFIDVAGKIAFRCKKCHILRSRQAKFLAHAVKQYRSTAASAASGVDRQPKQPGSPGRLYDDRAGKATDSAVIIHDQHWSWAALSGKFCRDLPVPQIIVQILDQIIKIRVPCRIVKLDRKASIRHALLIDSHGLFRPLVIREALMVAVLAVKVSEPVVFQEQIGYSIIL